jgi:hypothetical protein
MRENRLKSFLVSLGVGSSGPTTKRIFLVWAIAGGDIALVARPAAAARKVRLRIGMLFAKNCRSKLRRGYLLQNLNRSLVTRFWARHAPEALQYWRPRRVASPNFFVMYLVVVLIDRLFDEHLLTACGTTSTSRDVRFWSVHEIKPEVTLILAEFRS